MTEFSSVARSPLVSGERFDVLLDDVFSSNVLEFEIELARDSDTGLLDEASGVVIDERFPGTSYSSFRCAEPSRSILSPVSSDKFRIKELYFVDIADDFEVISRRVASNK
jgi:hypothetical protein